jgi:glucose/arabinose dehydrogenase
LKSQLFFIISSILALVLIASIKNNIYAVPLLEDSSLKAEVVAEGLNSPTSMAFLDKNYILVLEKNSGNVLLVSNGTLQKQPILRLRVDHTTLTCCRGLLGIAVKGDGSTQPQNVFLYYSELLDTIQNYWMVRILLGIDYTAIHGMENH